MICGRTNSVKAMNDKMVSLLGAMMD